MKPIYVRKGIKILKNGYEQTKNPKKSLKSLIDRRRFLDKEDLKLLHRMDNLGQTHERLREEKFFVKYRMKTLRF